MADSIDLTSFQEALKYKYTSDRVRLLGYRNNPLLAWLPKDESFGGRGTNAMGSGGLLLPVYYSHGKGRATTMVNAVSSSFQTAAEFVEFKLHRSKNYSVQNIDRQTLKAAKGNEHAFLDAQTALMDERVYELTRDTCNDLYKDGSGSRGVVSTVTGTTVTLSNASDIVNFEKGMPVEASQGAAFAAIRGAATTIASINRSAGSFVLTASIASLAPNDHLFGRGDRVASLASSVKLVGLQGWLPSAVTATDSFMGVNRSVDATRLGGIYYDGSSQTVIEAIIDAGTRAFREGAMPDVVFANPIQVAEVAKDLQGKAEYNPVMSADGKVSFDSFMIRTGAGNVPLVADPNCPVADAFMLQRNTWRLFSLGGVPELVDEDGQVLLRNSGADSFQVRFALYAQLGCTNPGKNVRINLAT